MVRLDVNEHDPAEQAWRLMRLLVLDRFDQRKVASAALDLSILRVKALGQLASAPLTLRDLAARLGVDPPHATVLVDGLEERGYVQRLPHETDRRAKLVSLTATGREAATISDRILNNPPVAVRELPDASLAALTEVLSALANSAGAPPTSAMTHGVRTPIDAAPHASAGTRPTAAADPTDPTDPIAPIRRRRGAGSQDDRTPHLHGTRRARGGRGGRGGLTQSP